MSLAVPARVCRILARMGLTPFAAVSGSRCAGPPPAHHSLELDLIAMTFAISLRDFLPLF